MVWSESSINSFYFLFQVSQIQNFSLCSIQLGRFATLQKLCFILSNTFWYILLELNLGSSIRMKHAMHINYPWKTVTFNFEVEEQKQSLGLKLYIDYLLDKKSIADSCCGRILLVTRIS